MNEDVLICRRPAETAKTKKTKRRMLGMAGVWGRVVARAVAKGTYYSFFISRKDNARKAMYALKRNRIAWQNAVHFIINDVKQDKNGIHAEVLTLADVASGTIDPYHFNIDDWNVAQEISYLLG